LMTAITSHEGAKAARLMREHFASGLEAAA
jgi:hypothetical protein